MLTLLLIACATSTPTAEPTAAEPPPAAQAAAPPKTKSSPETLGALSEISVAQLRDLLEAPEGLVLIDVRTDAEYQGGHIPGTVHIPMETLMASTDALADYAGQPIHLVCHSGGRSARVARQIADGGFDAVNVAGGTMAWQGAGYPIE